MANSEYVNIHLQIRNFSGSTYPNLEGFFRFLQGSSNVKHNGLDSVSIVIGTAHVYSASDEQIAFKLERGCVLELGLWLPANWEKLLINGSHDSILRIKAKGKDISPDPSAGEHIIAL